MDDDWGYSYDSGHLYVAGGVSIRQAGNYAFDHKDYPEACPTRWPGKAKTNPIKCIKCTSKVLEVVFSGRKDQQK